MKAYVDFWKLFFWLGSVDYFKLIFSKEGDMKAELVCVLIIGAG